MNWEKGLISENAMMSEQMEMCRLILVVSCFSMENSTCYIIVGFDGK